MLVKEIKQVADDLIQVDLPDLSKLLRDYFKRKEGKIGTKLRTKLKESMEYVRDRMVDLAPEVTGDLKSLISTLPVSAIAGNSAGFSLSNNGKISISMPLNRKKDRKILWVDRGTGVYGPSGEPIVPQSAPNLVFEIGGRIIRTKSVKGQKGQQFIRRALNVSKIVILSKVRSAIKES